MHAEHAIGRLLHGGVTRACRVMAAVRRSEFRVRNHTHPMSFEPINLVRHPDFTRFEDASGIEYEVHGSEDRMEIGFDIAASISTVLQNAERLLTDFMRHAGQFELSYVDVFDAPDVDGASFSLRFHFVADDDPHAFGYTYFDVYFTLNVPPSPRFWPIKFTVGFH